MTLVLIAGVTILLSLLMMLAWTVQRRFGNAGWVDVVWSFALGLAGVIYALTPAPDISWAGPRQILVAGLVTIWSMRDPGERFDRVVSVEMWEHMSNWQALLRRVRGWLHPDGRLFLHVFSHRSMPYRFDHADASDWIAQHFFTGGIMPSHGLIRHLDSEFTVEAEWRWSGVNYQHTADDWLANYDANTMEIDRILRSIHGRDAMLWKRRWRLFFLATAGLFAARNGTDWGVSHYRLRPR